MTQNPLVSAVMVNWNGAEHLRIALPSLKEQTYSPLEILVVDNGSGDDSKVVVGQSGATWVGLPRNIGLAPACNEGARLARGEYLVFLNNDMKFAPDFLENLVRPLLQDERIFATDALQMEWAGTNVIHQATRLRRRSLVASYLRPGLLPLLEIAQEPSERPCFAFQACAAAMAVRRSRFEALNGFDERLPVSWEDTEICWRAWMRGWGTVFVPAAACWHRVGASLGDNPGGAAARFKGTIGGRLLFAGKLLPAGFAVNSWLVSWLGVARDLATFRIVKAMHKAKVIIQYTSRLPRLISERRRLYKSAGTTPSAQLEKFVRMGRGEFAELTPAMLSDL